MTADQYVNDPTELGLQKAHHVVSLLSCNEETKNKAYSLTAQIVRRVLAVVTMILRVLADSTAEKQEEKFAKQKSTP